MPSLERGRMLGRYELLLPLDAARHSWIARFPATSGEDTIVALKAFPMRSDGDKILVDHVTRGVLFATTLHHENVVEIVDFDEQAGLAYLVMPWTHGESVADLLAAAPERGGIPLRIVANLVTQTCRGLTAVHELAAKAGDGFALPRCEVSPETILVARDGVAKLTEFGVGLLDDRVGCVTGRVDIGRGQRRLGYTAPEEFGDGTADARTDVFAVGILLYQMTTGRLPFGGDNGRESARRMLAGMQVVRPSTWLPDFPEALEAVLIRALAEAPEARYRAMLELERALSDVVAPCGNDEVSAHFATLFSERRVERDELLCAVLEGRRWAGPPRTTNAPEPEQPGPLPKNGKDSLPMRRMPVLWAAVAAASLGAVTFGLGGSCSTLKADRPSAVQAVSGTAPRSDTSSAETRRTVPAASEPGADTTNAATRDQPEPVSSTGNPRATGRDRPPHRSPVRDHGL